MEDIFKPSSLTIKELLGNTDSLYQVPRYQRPYSWGDDQLDKLWEDLLDAMENEPNYFLGSIITAKPEEKSTYLDIVDGQQRLTTLVIMLCVIRDLYPNINFELADSDPFAIDHKIIQSSIKFNDKFERLRLRTHSNHQSEFETQILNSNALKYKKPKKKDLKKEEEPAYKFTNTAHFFTDKFSSLGEEETGHFLNYLFNNVKIIRIDCRNVSFAIKLFQVLNDRGLDLSNADLVKSFLIGKIQSNLTYDSVTKKHKEDQFIDDWKHVENIATSTEISMNDLLVIYEYYLLEQNPKKSLYDELVSKLQSEDPNKVISDFKNFCKQFKEELYDKDDKTIYSFWYLRWSTYWRSILLAALVHNYPDYEPLKGSLRRFYYLNWIAGYTLSKIKQISFNIIKWIKEERPFSEIQKEIESHLSQYNTIQRAKDSLENDIYSEPWCKPLLFMIEYNQTDDSSMNFLFMWDSNIHTEHILPRSYKTNKDWHDFHEDPEIEEWINTGANLTLLSGKKNIEASNEGFDKKISTYNGKGLHNSKNDGVTAFRMTQKLADDYNSNRFARKWNWEALEERWNWFCDQVGEILDIDMSDRKI